MGDEYRSGWETGDGYAIIFDAGLGSWTYGVQDDTGDVVSSGRRADREPPTAISARRLRPTRSGAAALRSVALQAAVSSLRPSASPAPLLVQGAPVAPLVRNLPVILINFNDTATTYTRDDFSSLLFGNGTWSFRDYFEEVSRGGFSVSPGPAGVIGWVTASQGHDYYGARSGWGPPDAWPGDLAYEAVQQADADVDFSAYDNDGDCVVDTVAVIHQGNSQELSGQPGEIWSHSWSLSVTAGYGLGHHGPYTTNDRCVSNPAAFVVIDRYIMMPELYGSDIAGIGVFAHEYGHALGLIDLYDTDRTGFISEGIGDWSLMASGSWGGVGGKLGNRPSHPDPWSKLSLGWLVPERVTGSSAAATIGAVETGGGVSQFLSLPTEGGSGEYFLLENRQQIGFDEALPGSGLLLWHIDESRSGNNSEWYPGCTACNSHYKVALVQADNRYDLEKKVNRGDTGDPFPGGADNRAITPWTPLPASLYSGVPAGFGISAVSDSGMFMTAAITLYDFISPVSTIISYPTPVSASRSGQFTFSASEPALFACKLDDGAFLPCASPSLFTDLADGSHAFSVRATDLAGNMESAPPVYSWTVDTAVPLCIALVGDDCYQSIVGAYSVVPGVGNSTVRLLQGDHQGTLDLNRPVGVRLEGGYGVGFSSRPGNSFITGRLTISAGSLTVDTVVIRNDLL